MPRIVSVPSQREIRAAAFQMCKIASCAFKPACTKPDNCPDLDVYLEDAEAVLLAAADASGEQE